ncbi:MAG: hypothetical protein II875_01530 [Clostridia bacterium]|nr:hypothetical protein [Clostridia bacterium]
MRQSVVKALGIIIALILILAASVAGCEGTETLVFRAEKGKTGWGAWQETRLDFVVDGEEKPDAALLHILLTFDGQPEEVENVYGKDGATLKNLLQETAQADGYTDRYPEYLALRLSQYEYGEEKKLPDGVAEALTTLPDKMTLETKKGRPSVYDIKSEQNRENGKKYELNVYGTNCKYKGEDYTAFLCDLTYNLSGTQHTFCYIVLKPASEKGEAEKIGVKVYDGETEIQKDAEKNRWIVSGQNEIKIEWTGASGESWSNENYEVTEGDGGVFSILVPEVTGWSNSTTKTIKLINKTDWVSYTYPVKITVEKTDDGTEPPALLLIEGFDVTLEGAKQVEGAQDEWFVEGAQDVTVLVTAVGEGKFGEIKFAPEETVAEGGLLSTKDWEINETRSITVTATPENGAEFDEGVEGVRTVKLTRRPIPITAFVVTPEAEPEAGKYHVGKDGSLVFTWTVTGEVKGFEVKLGEKTLDYKPEENTYSCTVTGGDMMPGQELTLGISPFLYENGKFGGGVETRCEFIIVRDTEPLGDLTAVITSAEDFEGTYILQNNTKYTLKLEYEGEIEGEPELRCDRVGAISWEKINNKEFELTPVALGLEKVKITVEIRGYAQNEPTRTAEVSVIRWAETIKELTVKVNGAEAGEEVSYVGSETKTLEIEWSATGDVKGYTVTCSVDGEELEGYCIKEALDQKMTVPADIVEAGKTLCVKVEAVPYPHGKVADDKGSREIAIHRKYEKVEGLYIKDADGKEVKGVLTVKKDADVVLSWGAQGSVDKYVTTCDVDGVRLEDFSKETKETGYTIPAEKLPVGQTLNFSVKAVPFEGDDIIEEKITVKREVDKVSKVTVTVNGETVGQDKYVRVEKGTDIEIEWSADGEVAGFRTKMIVDGKEISKYSEESTQETGYTIPADKLPLGKTMTFRVTADAVEAAEKAVLDVEVYVRRDTIPVNNSIAAQLECVEKIPNLYLVRGDSIKLTWDYTGDANEVKINGQPWDPEAKEYSINISDMKIGDPSRTVNFEFCDYDGTVYHMQFVYALKPEDVDVTEPLYIDGHKGKSGVITVEPDRDVTVIFGFEGDVQSYTYRLKMGEDTVDQSSLPSESTYYKIPADTLKEKTEYTVEIEAVPYDRGNVVCVNPQTVKFRVDTSEIENSALEIEGAQKEGDVYLLDRDESYLLTWKADGTIKKVAYKLGHNGEEGEADGDDYNGFEIDASLLTLGQPYEATVRLTSYRAEDSVDLTVNYIVKPAPVESFTVKGIDEIDGEWRVERDTEYTLTFDAVGDVEEYEIVWNGKTQTVKAGESLTLNTSGMGEEEIRTLGVEAKSYQYGEVNADKQSVRVKLSHVSPEITDVEVINALKGPDGVYTIEEGAASVVIKPDFTGDAKNFTLYMDDSVYMDGSDKSFELPFDEWNEEIEHTFKIEAEAYDGGTGAEKTVTIRRREREIQVTKIDVPNTEYDEETGVWLIGNRDESYNLHWKIEGDFDKVKVDGVIKGEKKDREKNVSLDHTELLKPGEIYDKNIRILDEDGNVQYEDTVRYALRPYAITNFTIVIEGAEPPENVVLDKQSEKKIGFSAGGDVKEYSLTLSLGEDVKTVAVGPKEEIFLRHEGSEIKLVSKNGEGETEKYAAAFGLGQTLVIEGKPVAYEYGVNDAAPVTVNVSLKADPITAFDVTILPVVTNTDGEVFLLERDYTGYTFKLHFVGDLKEGTLNAGAKTWSIPSDLAPGSVTLRTGAGETMTATCSETNDGGRELVFTLPLDDLTPGQDRTVSVQLKSYTGETQTKALTYAIDPGRLSGDLVISADGGNPVQGQDGELLFRKASGASIKWNEIENASEYRVYVDGRLLDGTRLTAYSLRDLTTDEMHVVKVEAVPYPHGGTAVSDTIKLRLKSASTGLFGTESVALSVILLLLSVGGFVTCLVLLLKKAKKTAANVELFGHESIKSIHGTDEPKHRGESTIRR